MNTTTIMNETVAHKVLRNAEKAAQKYMYVWDHVINLTPVFKGWEVQNTDSIVFVYPDTSYIVWNRESGVKAFDNNLQMLPLDA